MIQDPVVLAIDTSCDETSASVVEGLKVLSNIQPSQMQLHEKYGGVVPSIARLAHQERIDEVVSLALERAHKKINEVNAIAVTIGPGLAIALEVGILKAKELCTHFNKPLLIINHMQAHLYSSFAERNSKNEFTKSMPKAKFPVLGFLISGGHTELIRVTEFGKHQKIGQTLDDSCGEAYDKCGRMLGLGYPAGPVISEFAKKHRSKIKLEVKKNNRSTVCIATNKVSNISYELPVPMISSDDLNFSYSGLKTAFSQLVNKLSGSSASISQSRSKSQLSKEQVWDLCVCFEFAAIKQLELKLEKAIKLYQPKEVWLGGGVIASSRLRSQLRKICKVYNVIMKYPYSSKLTSDNAAMVGVAASIKLQTQLVALTHNPDLGVFTKDFEQIDRDPSLSL